MESLLGNILESALLTGVFNQKPPPPRYTFAWDQTNMSDNSQLSDKDLTHKLTVLMVLSSASRTSSMQHLNIKFMVRNGMFYKFFSRKLHKSWRKGKAPPTISYQAQTQDPNICVVKTLDEYISQAEG